MSGGAFVCCCSWGGGISCGEVVDWCCVGMYIGWLNG